MGRATKRASNLRLMNHSPLQVNAKRMPFCLKPLKEWEGKKQFINISI
jgi:hypothetical protein